MAFIDFDNYGPYTQNAKKGADISFWQWGLDRYGNRTLSPNFEEMAKLLDAIIIRAGSINNSTGVSYTDYKYAQNLAGTVGVFPKTGAYWFLRLNWDVIKQAQYFATLVNGKGFDILVADAETPGDRGRVFQFLQEVEKLTGYTKDKLCIYTGPNAWNNLITGDKSYAIHYKLWNAHYQVHKPQTLEPWGSQGIEPLGHQFTAHGDGDKYFVESGNIDLNWFHPDWFKDTIPQPPPQNKIVEVISTGLNVRTQPVVSTATLIGSVPYGTRFEVVEEKDKWLGVKVYIHGDYVKEV